MAISTDGRFVFGHRIANPNERNSALTALANSCFCGRVEGSKSARRSLIDRSIGSISGRSQWATNSTNVVLSSVAKERSCPFSDVLASRNDRLRMTLLRLSRSRPESLSSGRDNRNSSKTASFDGVDVLISNFFWSPLCLVCIADGESHSSAAPVNSDGRFGMLLGTCVCPATMRLRFGRRYSPMVSTISAVTELLPSDALQDDCPWEISPRIA